MRFLNEIYNNINLLKIPNIRRKLIMSTSFLVLLLIMINFVLFYISTKNSYIQQLNSSNENLIKQIGFSYEMVIKNVKTSVYKTTLSDMDFIELVQNYNDSFDNKNSIYDKLYNIILSNEYIQSAYLYIPRYNQVFSTSNNTEKISSYENFSDQTAFCMIDRKTHYSLEPRIVEYNRTKKQILSIVSSIPLYNHQNTAFLVVNISLDQLRYNMMTKFKTNQNMHFYVIDHQNSIIITDYPNSSLRNTLVDDPINKISYNSFWRNILHSDMIIISVYDSKSLDWKFVLENSIDTSTSYAKKLAWFITVSISLLIISLLILIIVITIFTKPLNKMAVKYSEKIWKDFVTDNINLTDEIKEQLADYWLRANNAKFGVIILHIERTKLTDKILNYYKSVLDDITNYFGEKNGFKTNTITTGKDSITVIACYPNISSSSYCEEQHIKLAETIYDNIEPMHHSIVYLGISTIKEHITLIPSLYLECIEILKYKLICNSRLLSFSMIKNRKESYEYPYHLEKQLLNNLSVGNIESCMLILDEFFLLFTSPNIKVEDNEIIKSIYYLENSILKNISGLPISIECTKEINISNAQTINEIKAIIASFIRGICQKIIERSNDEKSKIYNTVLNYIDEYYTQPDISLNRIADTLNLNRNYVSKIISESTGNSFTDYINGKRIALAKKMLQDRDKTVKGIAEEVGFNYSYYFIKIFKNTEGITPGQYRSSISDS